MKTLGKKINFELVYSISVVLAFCLLFFANSENDIYTVGTVEKLNIGKAFYYPCGVALISTFFMPLRKDRTGSILFGMLVLACVSSIIHPPMNDNIMSWTLTRFVLGILCFKNIANVNPYVIAKLVAWFSPIVVALHYIYSDPFGFGMERYGGFYGDSNFLALGLIVIIVMCCITFRRDNNIVMRIIYVLSIIGAIPLIFVGRSRSGLIGIVMIVFFFLYEMKRKSKWIMLVIALIIVVLLYSLYIRYFDLFDYAFTRFSSDSQTDVVSTQLRLEQIRGVFNVLLNKPQLLPFGIGIGNTIDAMNYYAQYGFFVGYDVHNTFISLLYEGGALTLGLYVFLYYCVAKKLYTTRDYFLISLFFTLILSLSTLPGVAFMPGWITLFFLCNEKLYMKGDPQNLDKLG